MEESRTDVKSSSLFAFIKENQRNWWIVGFFILYVYGIKVFNISISHDTESIMSIPDYIYGAWYMMGRFGLVFLKKLLGSYFFNPYIAAFMMVVLMLCNSIVWEYLIFIIKGSQGPKTTLWIFPVLFFTSGISAEQSEFLLQAYEVNLALLMVAVVLILFFRGILKRKKWYYCAAAFLCVIAFSTYQSLIPLFAASCALCFLLIYDRISADETKEIQAKEYWLLIGKMILFCVGSFIIYQLINKLVLEVHGLEPTPYISGQIMWGTIPAKQCVINIVRHVYMALTGKRFLYSASFGVVYAAIVLVTIVRIKKRETCYWIYCLAVIFCLGAPFLMAVLMGNAPTIRADILLPFTVGFLMQYLVEKLFEKAAERPGINGKQIRIAVVCAVFIASFTQSAASARLYYTQYVQYEEDVRRAVKITDRIDQLGLGEIPREPVVFVGYRMPQLNRACYPSEQLELIGRSFFELSYGTKHGTWVMNLFLNTIGYTYNMPSPEQSEQAEKDAEDMPVWPAQGSVAEKNGVIIVKLSEAYLDEE